MLVLTISRRHESGRVEPIVAINDLPFVRSVLERIGTIVTEEEEDDSSNLPKLTVVGGESRGGVTAHRLPSPARHN